MSSAPKHTPGLIRAEVVDDTLHAVFVGGRPDAEIPLSVALAAPGLLEALELALSAMQKNIAYATRKDEHALAEAIPVASAALAKARGGK